MTTFIFGILSLASFITAIISGVVGMGGGTILLGVMTFFLPLQVIVPIHGIVQLASNSSRSLFLIKSIHKKIILWFALGLPLGNFIAFKILKAIDNRDFVYYLIAGVIFYTLFKPKKLPAVNLPFKGFMGLGFIIGILAPLMGASGPILAPFFLRKDLEKEQIVATKAMCQTFGHLSKIPLFLMLDFNYGSYSLLMILMVACVVIGSKVGTGLLKRLDEKYFLILFKGTLLIAGVRVLYKAIF